MADAPRYRFGPLEKRGVLMGLRAGQLAVVAAALVVAVATLSAAPRASGLGLSALAAVAIAFVPVAGRTLEQWSPLATRWLIRGLRSQRRTVTRQPGRGVSSTH